MRTDRELLELAAKAAGLPYTAENFIGQGVINSLNWGMVTDTLSTWNPLTDDGDALRLAVTLHISVLSNIVRVEVSTIQLTLDKIFIHESTLTQEEGAATRRAIVRAAAEIGAASQPHVSKGEEGNG